MAHRVSAVLVPMVVASMLTLTAHRADAVVIDTFLSGQDVVSFGDSPSTVASGDAIGGWRTIEVVSSDTNTALRVFPTVLGGFMGPAQNFGGVSSSKATWDANGIGLGGIDLTDGGIENALLLDMLFIAPESAVTVSLVDTSTNSASISRSGITDSSAVQSFLFAELVGTVDLTSIDSIMLTMDLAPETSALSILSVETGTVETVRTPEPATAMLFGIALAATGAVARRRKVNRA